MAVELNRNVTVYKKDGYTLLRYGRRDPFADRWADWYLADPSGTVIWHEIPIVMGDPVRPKTHREVRDLCRNKIPAEVRTSALWVTQPKKTMIQPPGDPPPPAIPAWVRWALTRTGHDFTAIAPGEPEPI